MNRALLHLAEEIVEVAATSDDRVWVVETGQPLVISNLDLTFLPRFDRREAMSFFNMCPCSHGSFNLANAARMNATFPLISPAVSLPTVPERRVVDAGFYDNYGVSLAAAYLGDGAERRVPSDCLSSRVWIDERRLRRHCATCAL